MKKHCPRLVARKNSRHRRLAQFDVAISHRGVINATELRTGEILSRARNEEAVLIWEPHGIRASKQLDHGAESVIGARKLRSGKILSWDAGGFLRLWTPDRGKSALFKGDCAPICDALELDEHRIVTWTADEARIWRHKSSSWESEIIFEPSGLQELGVQALPGERMLFFDRWRELSGNGSAWIWVDGRTYKLPYQEEGVVPFFICELGDSRLLSLGRDNTLTLWHYDGQLEIRRLSELSNELSGACQISADRLLTWDEEGGLHLIDPKAQSKLRFIGRHEGRVSGACQLSTDRLLSWSEEGALRFWTRNGEALSAPIKAHTDKVVGARELADGRILSWSGDSTLRLWLPNGRPDRAPLVGHTGEVFGALALTDGRTLSWGEDGKMLLWPSLRPSPNYRSDWRQTTVSNVVVLSDNRIVSLCRRDGSVRFWQSDGMPEGGAVKGHSPSMNMGASEFKDGRLMSWGGGDTTIHIWSPEGRLLSNLLEHAENVRGAIELRDGRCLSWSGIDTLTLWTFAPVLSGCFLKGHRSPIQSARELIDGRILSWDRESLRFWHPDGRPDCILRTGHDSGIGGVLELSNGRILTWSDVGLRNPKDELHLWHPTGQDSFETLGEHEDTIVDAFQLSDGRVLSWGHDATLRLWSLDAQASGKPLKGHAKWVAGACELNDGRILSWGGDGDLRIWAPDGRSDGAPLVGGRNPVDQAYETSGGCILSWSRGDGSLRLWRPPLASPIYNWPITELANFNPATGALIADDLGHIFVFDLKSWCVGME